MSNAFSWRISRLLYFARRIKGSIAQRGVRGAFQRLLQQRTGLRTMLGATDTMAVPSMPLGEPRRGRILVVDSMVPDPIRDSGSMRLSQMMRLLCEEGWQIDFFAADGFATPADTARLAAIGVRYQSANPWRWLRQHGPELDAVLLCRLPVASQYLDIVRETSPKAKVVFDTVDLHYVREQRAAALTGNKRLYRHAAQSRRCELDAISRSDVTLVVSEEEQMTLIRELPDTRVQLLSNIHEVHGRRSGFDERRDLLFIGGFGHPPNADAMQWFAAEVLPLLRISEPELVLHLVGDIDEASRRALNRDGIKIHGRVDDIRPLMESCRVSVAPLRFGAGVKGKVNLAMSYGLPVVVTSIAAEGMFLVNGTNALIADQATAFAEAILQLYRDHQVWMRLSEGALENVRQHFSVEQARRTLQQVFTDAPKSPTS
ncbi:glycosyltransferase [Dyella japonica]|uniref:Glycosyltransferase involved in cell wall biosynthesis n=1 Tax=Dyella japonica TaxID=231455 RepID=A0ABV2JW34_9GAMM